MRVVLPAPKKPEKMSILVITRFLLFIYNMVFLLFWLPLATLPNVILGESHPNGVEDMFFIGAPQGC